MENRGRLWEEGAPGEGRGPCVHRRQPWSCFIPRLRPPALREQPGQDVTASAPAGPRRYWAEAPSGAERPTRAPRGAAPRKARPRPALQREDRPTPSARNAAPLRDPRHPPAGGAATQGLRAHPGAGPRPAVRLAEPARDLGPSAPREPGRGTWPARNWSRGWRGASLTGVAWDACPGLRGTRHLRCRAGNERGCRRPTPGPGPLPREGGTGPCPLQAEVLFRIGSGAPEADGVSFPPCGTSSVPWLPTRSLELGSGHCD